MGTQNREKHKKYAEKRRKRERSIYIYVKKKEHKEVKNNGILINCKE